MLQRIRDSLQAQKWLAYVVLGALALVFAAWGAYGIVNLNLGGSNYAAEAGGQKISLEQARNAWLQQQTQFQQRFGGELPAQLKQQMQDQVLERLIRDALLYQRSHDLGYRVSEDDLKQAILSEPAFQGSDGQYSAAIAKMRLSQAGLSLATFEGELRSSLQRSQLADGIRSSEFLTPRELERSEALQNEQREVRFAKLSADKFQAAAQPDDAAVQAYYKAHQSEYLTPESVHLQYAELRLDQLSTQSTVTDADLHAAYDKQKGRFVEPEKRHAHHILITADKDDAAARKKAEDVLAQAKAGKDFGQLAKQYSQDPGSAQNGGDLGWTERGNLEAPFADALFSMSQGEIRGPVKTRYGYHIIRLDEVQAGKIKTFEEARPELETEVKRDHATDRFGEIQEQLQTRLEQPGADLSALAKEFNLESGEVAQFERGSGGAPLGPAPQLQEVVFGDSPVAVGSLSSPVLLGDDRLVVVKVLDHHKPDPKPLAAVRDGIVAAIRKEQGTEAAFKAAEGARSKLESGTAFDDVIHELNVTSEPARFVGRNDSALPAPIRELVFDAPKPGDKPVYRVLKMDDGGAAVVAITKIRPGAVDGNKPLQSTRAKQEAMRSGAADELAYVDQVRRTSDVRKNPNAFE